MKVAARVVAIALAAYVGLSIFGAAALMEVPRLPLHSSPASVGLAYEEVSFASRDEIVLRGWYIPAQGDSALVIVNGGFQNRIDDTADTLGLARDLVQKGYNLLLFDLRGRGESEGKGCALSHFESDIGGAVDYLTNMGYTTSKIGLVGFCSGAASLSIFASHENIGGLVLDGCFTSVRHMVDRQAAQRGIPQFLLDAFMPGLAAAAKTIYGYDEVNPIDVVAEVSCPILFIHEEYDELVSLDDVSQLLKASTNPANMLWEVNGAKHSQAYKTQPSEYVEKVNEFFAMAFKETHH
jgi:pimeloyl-ACP methyl ester carboxylesterase